VFAEYVQAAMNHTVYELAEDGTYIGTISGFQGVIANGATLEATRRELLDVLEGWVLLGISLHHDLPAVDGRKLVLPAVNAYCRRLARSSAVI
jgi:predicted RNase H-like HicB family nuclease